MTTYWLSFRIKEIGDYSTRYARFTATVADIAGTSWWEETTSFYIFKSELSRAAIARRLKEAFDQDCDIALLGMIDFKGQTIIGSWDDPDLTSFLTDLSQA